MSSSRADLETLRRDPQFPRLQRTGATFAVFVIGVAVALAYDPAAGRFSTNLPLFVLLGIVLGTAVYALPLVRFVRKRAFRPPGR